MDEQVARLTDKAWGLYEAQPPSRRLLVAIAGMPGSGKTTLATHVVDALNARHAAAHPALASAAAVAALVPMDGFHLTRAQLSALPDPAAAHARRGAPFTFDARAYLALVRRLRRPVAPEDTAIWAPSFDHAVKDPVERGVAVRPEARIVVLEGNYVGMEGAASGAPSGGQAARGKSADEDADEDFQPATDDECWGVAKALVDEVWFVDVAEGTARDRLAARHVAAGICDSLDAGRRRADENDLPNGRELTRRRGRVDELVQSREDAAWAPKRT